MKIAAKTVPVYASDGSKQIGELCVGDETLVIGETQSGTVIAYILGLVKEEYAACLVDADAWEEEAGEVDRFLAYALSVEGCLYVWGAQGQEMTPSLIKKLENGATNYKRALAHYEKHVESGQTLAAYDCSGLIVAYLLENGYIGSDTTANGLYFNHCAAIEKSGLTAGDLVFRKYTTKNKMYHVGVYIGDGTVVHAKGRDYGVVREPLLAVNWNRYGRLHVFADESADAVYSRKLKNTGRPYMQGDDVRAVQTALKSIGFDPGGIDGIYGSKTEKAVKAFQTARGLEVDGIVGPKTWAALMT
ncbi:MAG: peptidoglycan-binding protein [Eubacteriales bacterium]|nr:peptidoglycan-binding protein [Eubacteriales bacterium]